MEYFKSPFSVYLSKDMFVTLFKNVELLSKAIADNNKDQIIMHSLLSTLKVLEAHFSSLKVVRIKLTDIVSDEELKSFCNIERDYLENLAPFESSKDKKEADMTHEEILQLHILDASDAICKELDII